MAFLAVLAIGGGTVGLVVLGGGDDPVAGGGSGAADDGVADGTPGGDEQTPDGGERNEPPAADPPTADSPAPVDPTGLDDLDAAFAELLNDVDGAERTMLDFQEQFARTLTSAAGPDDLDAVIAEVVEIADRGRRDLARLREALTTDMPDGAVAAVRDRYVTHLDAWVRYLEEVEANPAVLGGGADGGGLLVAINTTADAFVRELRSALPSISDRDVLALAEAIIERGFPERELADEDTV